jgi:hypothetical protein
MADATRWSVSLQISSAGPSSRTNRGNPWPGNSGGIYEELSEVRHYALAMVVGIGRHAGTGSLTREAGPTRKPEEAVQGVEWWDCSAHR